MAPRLAAIAVAAPMTAEVVSGVVPLMQASGLGRSTDAVQPGQHRAEVSRAPHTAPHPDPDPPPGGPALTPSLPNSNPSVRA
jgi:hypothetical protein